MPITIGKIELFCSLLFFSPTSLQRAKNACFSLIFPEKSAFRNGFELRRSDVKKDLFFNIFRRRSVESSSDNFRFFPTNTVSFDIYQKTRNRFVLNRARGFESHHLRQKCLCIARCRGTFSFRTPSSPLRPFRHFSQLRPPSLVQHAQKDSIFLCKKP